MPGHSLLMRFRVLLSEDISDRPIEPIGPLFYRWLPDGEKDRIEVPTDDENVSLRLWFERCGFVERGFVRFNYKRREVDPVVMSGQSPLNGGPLRGVIEFQGLSAQILTAIRNNRAGDDIYRSFGKRVVNLFLHPCLSRFIAVLRANYGQFWLPEFRAWDSTRKSLGAYCHDLNLMWSDDDGQHWKEFVPDEPVYSFHAGPDTGREYLGEAEWRELGQAMMAGYEASTAARLIGRAHEVLEAGDLRYAAAEAVTALEVALSEVIRSRVPKDIADRVGSFWNLPIATRLAIAAALIGGIDEDQPVLRSAQSRCAAKSCTKARHLLSQRLRKSIHFYR